MDANNHTLVRRSCRFCGTTFYAHRSDALYCSNRCRTRAFRWRKRLPYQEERAVFALHEVCEYLHFEDSVSLASSILQRIANQIETELRQANIKRVRI